MDMDWSTITLALDPARPHPEAADWVIERVRLAEDSAAVARVRVVRLAVPSGRPGARSGTGVDDAVARVREAAPSLVVESSPDLDPSATDTGVLVVGTFRDARGTTSGRVPGRVAERAAVPTVVVPDQVRTVHGDVVIAVDEPLDDRALAAAVAEATVRRRRLTLLRAWEMPVLTRTGLTDFAEEPLRWRTRNAALLARADVEVGRRYPSVRRHQLLVEGQPGRAIAAHTRRASLVVLGQGHVRLLSGSVLHDLLREALCPVLVLPAAGAVGRVDAVGDVDAAGSAAGDQPPESAVTTDAVRRVM